jgi:hypothetical protein
MVLLTGLDQQQELREAKDLKVHKELKVLSVQWDLKVLKEPRELLVVFKGLKVLKEQ